MAKKSKDFLVSTADVAFYVNDQLAFTGTTSLNTSLSVSMEDQEITGGKVPMHNMCRMKPSNHSAGLHQVVYGQVILELQTFNMLNYDGIRCYPADYRSSDSGPAGLGDQSRFCPGPFRDQLFVKFWVTVLLGNPYLGCRSPAKPDDRFSTTRTINFRMPGWYDRLFSPRDLNLVSTKRGIYS